MNKRKLMRYAAISPWITPIVASVLLPVHAMTSSGIRVRVIAPVPDFTITIEDDKPNFNYSYQVNNGSIISGASSNGEKIVTIVDTFTGQIAGTTQSIVVSVTDSDGNQSSYSFIFTIEG